MKLEKNILVFLLAGIVVGILLTAAVTQLAYSRACPQSTCVDEAEILPLSNRGYFPAVHRALQEADKSIHIATFELKYYEEYPDSLENTIIKDIIEAKKRGVEVKIIVDEYSKSNNAFDLLREEGVDIIYDSKSVTTHAKLVIIDGELVILGSTNFSYYGLEKNNEANVLIESSKIAEYYEEYFSGLWEDLIKNAA